MLLVHCLILSHHFNIRNLYELWEENFSLLLELVNVPSMWELRKGTPSALNCPYLKSALGDLQRVAMGLGKYGCPCGRHLLQLLSILF